MTLRENELEAALRELTEAWDAWETRGSYSFEEWSALAVRKVNAQNRAKDLLSSTPDGYSRD